MFSLNRNLFYLNKNFRINRLKEAHKGVDEKTLIDANTLAKKRMFNSKGGNAEASHIIDRLNDINKG